MRITAFVAAVASLVLVTPLVASSYAAAQGQAPGAQGDATAQQGGRPPVDDRTAEDFSASHLAAAQDIVELTQSDTAFDDILPRLALQTQDIFTRSNPSLTREIEDAVYEVATELAQQRVELSRTIQLIWARRFTESELNELKTFFQSSAGKKFVELTPVITALSVGAARQWEQGLSTAMVEDTRAKLREKGFAL